MENKNIFNVETKKDDKPADIKKAASALFAIGFVSVLAFTQDSVINLSYQINIIFKLLFYGVFGYSIYLMVSILINKLTDEKLKNQMKNRLLALTISFFGFFMLIESFEYQTQYKNDYKKEPKLNFSEDRLHYKYANIFETYFKKNLTISFSKYIRKTNIETGPVHFFNNLSYAEGQNFIEFKNNNYNRRDGDIILAYLKNKY